MFKALYIRFKLLTQGAKGTEQTALIHSEGGVQNKQEGCSESTKLLDQASVTPLKPNL